MIPEYRHYKVSSGEGHEIISTWHAEVKAGHAKIDEIAVRYGAVATKYVMFGTKVEGLYFMASNAPDPKLWKPIAKHLGYFRANKRTKGGKEIDAALDAIRFPSSHDLAVRLGCQPFFRMNGQHFMSDLGWQKVGEDYYLEAPFFSSPPVKPGMELISRADYYLAIDGPV